MVVGRSRERARLERLLEEARAGRSGALLLHGEPGIGKTALLRWLAEQADGMLVLRARGIETESDIPFAGLAELITPLLDRLDAIPDVEAEGIAMVGALRDSTPVARMDVPWLERLPIGPLEADDARAVLASGGVERIAPAVADRLVATAGGNPLALVELPEVLSDAQLAGRGPLAEPLRPGATVERAFRMRIEALPEPGRRALLVAASAHSLRVDVIQAGVRAAGRRGGGVRRAGARHRAAPPALALPGGARPRRGRNGAGARGAPAVREGFELVARFESEAIGAELHAALGGLELGLGRVPESIEALEAYDRIARRSDVQAAIVQALPDLVEAYVRAGRREDAEEALGRLEADAEKTGSGWARAAAARSRALLAPDEEVRALFETALSLAGGLPMPFERARALLAFGERLRRAKQRAEARAPLQEALDAFERLGARP